jgi:hypothetical protein
MSEQLTFEEVAEQEANAEESRQAMVDWAYRRQRRIAEDGLNRPHAETPEQEAVLSADWRTSLADARAAYSLANGSQPDDLNPTTGKLHNARAYECLRRGWQRWYDRAVMGSSGADPDELIVNAEVARQEFLAVRRDLDDGAPWIEPRRYSH